MRTVLTLSFVISITLAAFTPAGGQEVVPRTFDHTIYVEIQSAPPGAEVHAVSATEKRITSQLGVSPCTMAIGLKWGERFGRRSWPALNVWSPGDACRAEYNASQKTYDLYFTCAAVKRGYFAKDIEVKIATLTKPSYGWEAPDSWPQRVLVNIDLVEKNEEAAGSDNRPERIPKVILAANADEGGRQLGTIQVRCDEPDAYVYIDGKRTRTAPVDVMVPEGWHTISVRKDGYPPYRTDVNLGARSTRVVQATFE